MNAALQQLRHGYYRHDFLSVRLGRTRLGASAPVYGFHSVPGTTSADTRFYR
ncbi:hypothetical protein [Varibaculum vaginae]|uniref:hypothetical protein n=1 Tax=Varibaculum vaginae TaxID=2364797 RepID=UPI00190F332A|nr:hypothetical protein [Varibaculum vaginae]